MKISQQHIDKIRDRIDTLNECLNQIETKHPSETTCYMGATISNLSHILDEIDSNIARETVEPNYLTYDEFMRKLLENNKSTVADWYVFVRTNSLTDESNLDFYQRKIKYINKYIVLNL